MPKVTVYDQPGIEKVAYILPQGRTSKRSRASGRPVQNRCSDGGGFVVVGMYESLGKTFATYDAAVKYVAKEGFVLKTNRILHRRAP